MTDEQKETLADGKDALKVAKSVGEDIIRDMAIRLGSEPYSDGGQKLLLARAELEGARKFLHALMGRVLPK